MAFAMNCKLWSYPVQTLVLHPPHCFALFVMLLLAFNMHDGVLCAQDHVKENKLGQAAWDNGKLNGGRQVQLNKLQDRLGELGKHVQGGQGGLSRLHGKSEPKVEELLPKSVQFREFYPQSSRDANGAVMFNHLPRRVRDTVKAVENVVAYYKSMFRGMNLDGLFGLRVAEGQLGSLEFPLDPRIDVLLKNIRDIVTDALDINPDKDREYFGHFLPLLSRPFVVHSAQRNISKALYWTDETYNSETGKKGLSEELSNECITGILGTAGVRDHPCTGSRKCGKVMTEKGFSGYSLTHQLLYVIIAELWECGDVIAPLLSFHGASLEDYYSVFCSNVYSQLLGLFRNGNIHADRDAEQDLFMEQVFICGGLGFSEFLNPQFLTLMLHWQQPNGCFLDGGPPRVMEAVKPGARRLMVERSLSDGCLAHKTSVAFGALSVFLRSQLEKTRPPGFAQQGYIPPPPPPAKQPNLDMEVERIVWPEEHNERKSQVKSENEKSESELQFQGLRWFLHFIWIAALAFGAYILFVLRRRWFSGVLRHFGLS